MSCLFFPTRLHRQFNSNACKRVPLADLFIARSEGEECFFASHIDLSRICDLLLI